jgi:hypothetical protein
MDTKKVNQGESSIRKREKINSKWSEIKHIFFEWSKEAPFDCYPKIFQQHKHKSLSIVWLVIFIFFASMTFFILYRSISEYFDRETVTKIEIKHERPLMFPTVTICDADPFTTKKSQEFFHKTAQEEYGVDLENISFQESFSKTAHTTEIIKMRVASLTRNEKQKLGFGINQIYDLQFDGVPSEPKSHLSWFYSFDYGNCYQFNSGRDYNDTQIEMRETIIQVSNL